VAPPGATTPFSRMTRSGGSISMANSDDERVTGPDDGVPEEPPPKPEVSLHRFASLTPQEHRLLNLVADGFTDKEIGDRLSISERAVAKYVEDMVAKLGLQNRTQAILFAINRAFQGGNSSPGPSDDQA
jgi:DNA-binding NarL/FixJ family response regulator